ncbi:MAG TPA: DUF370 domain-containing protein [Hydrogenispora sp.]|jgi:hypothetical protein|nr:DUF370 domain-containing protein [Hydrogenispora sp.]
MFLHLGGKQIINTNEVILVENVEKMTWTALEEWKAQKKKAGQEIMDIAEGKPKSAIYTEQKIILSPISSYTLKKRAGQIPD